MSSDPYAAASHYDRVIPAWELLLGDDLHYGEFRTGRESLAEATRALTNRMASHARLGPGLEVLDVGCGTGNPAAELAERFGCRVTGISTSAEGIDRARRRAEARGLASRVSFLVADGMRNGFADESFDRVWVLESSHLMLDKSRLASECARVLRPGGRLTLCDIVLRKAFRLEEVIRHRDEFLRMRQAFGEARMELPERYVSLFGESGLEVEVVEDLSAAARPTLRFWQENAEAHRDRVARLIGEESRRTWVAACAWLAHLWDEGMVGYALLAAVKPA